MNYSDLSEPAVKHFLTNSWKCVGIKLDYQTSTPREMNNLTEPPQKFAQAQLFNIRSMIWHIKIAFVLDEFGLPVLCDNLWLHVLQGHARRTADRYFQHALSKVIVRACS